MAVTLPKAASIVSLVASICLLVLAISYAIRILDSTHKVGLDNISYVLIGIFLPLQTILITVTMIAQDMKSDFFIRNCRFAQFYLMRCLIFIFYSLIYFNNNWLQWATGVISIIAGILCGVTGCFGGQPTSAPLLA